MSGVTYRLHLAFVLPLSGKAVPKSNLFRKPLEVDLALPHPPRLRVYMYSLVGGAGTKRSHEYKAVLRVPGQVMGQYGAFDFSGGRLPLLIAYRSDLDVFVLWDASLHARFKWGGNIQVREDVVLEAAAVGRAEQKRTLTAGVQELVIACQSRNLLEAIDDRVSSTGGLVEEPCRASRS